MFWKNVQRRYALTDNGIRNIKKGTAWTVIVNLIVMGGMGILYLLMSGYMDTLTEGAPPADSVNAAAVFGYLTQPPLVLNVRQQ